MINNTMTETASRHADFGGDIMTMGEATESISSLNGVQVRAYDGETGMIYNVLIERSTRVAQIWVNMTRGGARCFRPHHLTRVDGAQLIIEATP